jgi:hypothetical protein
MEEIAPGKKQELLYWDDSGYASVYDSVTYAKALEKKQEEDKLADVDAFLSSLESESKPPQESEVVAAPPSINLSLGGSLYALQSIPAHRASFVAPFLILFTLVMHLVVSQKVS